MFSYPSVLTYVSGAHCHGSFEYPQHKFWLRNTKNDFLVRTLNLKSCNLLFQNIHFSNESDRSNVSFDMRFIVYAFSWLSPIANDSLQTLSFVYRGDILVMFTREVVFQKIIGKCVFEFNTLWTTGEKQNEVVT